MRKYRVVCLILIGFVFQDLFAQTSTHHGSTNERKAAVDTVKNSMRAAIVIATNPIEKEQLYKKYLQSYPRDSSYNNFKLLIAIAYLQDGKLADYKRWQDQVINKSTLISQMNSIAYSWAQKNEKLDEAKELSKETLQFINLKINHLSNGSSEAVTTSKSVLQASYDAYADTYAFILYKQNKPKEALTYEQPVYEKSKGDDPETNEHYALILKAAGEDQKAKTVIENAIKAGKSSTEMNATLKDIYTKEKKSDHGYEQYYAALKNTAEVAAREQLTKEMMMKPAPQFTLKDTSGNVISLASMKGKVVVVDFWATWCGPCKASFPGMQMAVNKFKDDPNVKFLFIDTWENGDNYLPGVEKFITDNKYTFHVLMDEKGADGRQSKVVSAFGVDGIPTKFIIDKNGNIRFTKVGFDGTAESIRDEVAMMIELTNNADLPKVEKVSMLK